MSGHAKKNLFNDKDFVDEELIPKLMVVGEAGSQFSPLIKRLSNLDIQIYSVNGCIEAIECAKDHDFFLILLGADEQQARGMETAFALRANEVTRNIPVVFISQVDGAETGAADFGIAGADYVLTPVPTDVVQKEVSVFLEMYQHRKELEHSEQMYRTMATRDPLTLLGNREQFETDLKKSLANARRHGYMVAVLHISLDSFKAAETLEQHKVSDNVLLEVAERLKRCTREGDSIARLGVGEFGVLLNMVRDAESVGMVANKVLDILRQPVQFKLKGQVVQSVFVDPCIGVAHYPQDGDSYKLLLHNADMAMYQAKRSGHHC